MKAKEYNAFLKKLPHGTITEAAKKLKVRPQGLYKAIKADNVTVIKAVIDSAEKIEKGSQAEKSKVKELIESI